MKKLLIDMLVESTTNKYNHSFSYPLLLLKQCNCEVEHIIDLNWRLWARERKWPVRKSLRFDIINDCLKELEIYDFDEVIVNFGNYPTDADKFELYEYFLKRVKRKIKVMGFYPTIFPERLKKFNNVEIIETDFNTCDVNIPFYFISHYPMVGKKLRAKMRISYGCPHKCSMCPTYFTYNGNFYYNDLNKSIEMIKDYYNKGIRYITFVDDNIAANPKKFVEFLKMIKSEKMKGMKYHVQEGFQLSSFINEEMCSLIKELKFVEVSVGLENIKESFLKKINKCYNKKSIIDKALNNIKKYNIDAKMLYLLGIDESENDILDNLKFLSENHFKIIVNIIRDFDKKFVFENKFERKLLRNYASLANAINFLSNFEIDVFNKDDYEKMKKEFKLVEIEKDFGYEIRGKIKLGPMTNQFVKGFHYLFQLIKGKKYKVKEFDDYLKLTKLKEKRNLSKFLKGRKKVSEK